MPAPGEDRRQAVERVARPPRRAARPPAAGRTASGRRRAASGLVKTAPKSKSRRPSAASASTSRTRSSDGDVVVCRRRPAAAGGDDEQQRPRAPGPRTRDAPPARGCARAPAPSLRARASFLVSVPPAGGRSEAADRGARRSGRMDERNRRPIDVRSTPTGLPARDERSIRAAGASRWRVGAPMQTSNNAAHNIAGGNRTCRPSRLAVSPSRSPPCSALSRRWPVPRSASAAAGCPAAPLSNPFSPWGDDADYQLAPEGDIEDGGASWSLAGGAAAQEGNETFHGRRARRSPLAAPARRQRGDDRAHVRRRRAHVVSLLRQARGRLGAQPAGRRRRRQRPPGPRALADRRAGLGLGRVGAFEPAADRRELLRRLQRQLDRPLVPLPGVRRRGLVDRRPATSIRARSH